MNKRNVFSLIVAVLLLLAFPASTFAGEKGVYDQQFDDGIVVTKQIMTDPSTDDKDWPIVRIETSKFTDPKTGETWSRNKLEAWWTRSSTSWSAGGATILWGCNGCTKCDGTGYSSVYQDGPFTPSWQNNTSTYVYQYTALWPAMRPNPPWAYIIGHSDSTAYYSGQNQGALAAYADY